MNDVKRRLVRRSGGGRVAGVCAGIAEYLETDVTLVRVAWVEPFWAASSRIWRRGL